MSRRAAGASIALTILLGVSVAIAVWLSDLSEPTAAWVVAVEGVAVILLSGVGISCKSWARVPLVVSLLMGTLMIKSTLVDPYDPSGMDIYGYVILNVYLVVASSIALGVIVLAGSSREAQSFL